MFFPWQKSEAPRGTCEKSLYVVKSGYEATMDSTAQNPYAGSSLRQMKLWSWQARAIPAHTRAPARRHPYSQLLWGFPRLRRFKTHSLRQNGPRRRFTLTQQSLTRSTAHSGPSPISGCMFEKNCQILN
ncbi:protein LLP homolog isoform X1 [Sagmatias obliquidens]|uniref:protein LLP homolog isoform X1 n=1 Tax=Sagmatias obliquidens TaxID=3371155 RepID=UPI000F440F20|nr:protein LLP homolog isoform X1 [Lagenorhynchus obliquidens]